VVARRAVKREVAEDSVRTAKCGGGGSYSCTRSPCAAGPTATCCRPRRSALETGNIAHAAAFIVASASIVAYIHAAAATPGADLYS
jgi:hypothetical protein